MRLKQPSLFHTDSRGYYSFLSISTLTGETVAQYSEQGSFHNTDSVCLCKGMLDLIDYQQVSNAVIVFVV